MVHIGVRDCSEPMDMHSAPQPFPLLTEILCDTAVACYQ